MMKRSVATWLTGACAVAVASGAQAQASSAVQNNEAQSTPQAQQGAGSAAQNDQEAIVITAEKRPQLLIDVPQSVSVVSGQTLEAQHATNFQDYLKLVPGLQLNQSDPGEGRLIVRGINTGGVASVVSVYVDETPFGSSTGLVNGGVLAADFDTFDLARIEVLRGPQGTLYGASSLGGVLRFVTNAPSTDALIVRSRVGLETVDGGDLGYNANLAINIPLSNTLAFRASGSYRKDGGFIDSIGTVGSTLLGFGPGPSDIAKNINDDKVYGGRASLLFKPSDAASIRLTAIAQNLDADAPTLIEADPVTLKPLHGLSQSQWAPQFSNLHYRLYNATGDFSLGFGTLTTSTSFAKQDQDRREDFSNLYSGFLQAPPPIGFNFPPNNVFIPQQTNLDKFTQEVRLAGQSRLVDWLVGGFYAHEKGLIVQDLIASEPDTLTPILDLQHVEVASKYQELAGFADATVHVTQQFDLQFGGRYSGNKQSSEETSGPVDLKNHSRENVFTYSLAPKYKINPNTTLYARVAKGFRPGGPNVVAPTDPSLATYHSDTVTSYEAGVKAQTADHRFSIDAAAFHIKWKDIQLFTQIGIFGVNINGSEAKSDGVELTASARPIRGLELSLNGAYTNARLTADTPKDVGGRDGDQLPFTPKLSVALNGDYHWYVSSRARAHVGASLRHLGGQTADYDPEFVKDHGHQRHVDPYSVVDLFAGVDWGQFNLEVYAKNLGNSHGVTSTVGPTVSGLPLYPGGAIGTGIIRPRTFGLTVGFDL
jgi:outer membrane receptor protein involved in Fe transport